MNPNSLADIPTTVAEFGLTWLCQSSALLALGLLAGRLLRARGPAVQSAVYRTTLGAVLICPAAALLMARAGIDGVNLRFPVGTIAPAPVPGPMVPATPARTLAGIDRADRRIEGTERTPDEKPTGGPPSLPALGAPQVSAPSAPAAPANPASPPRWVVLAVTVGLGAWGLGTGFIAVRMVVAAGRMARLRAAAIGAEPEAEALCRDLATAMRLSTPRVLRSPFLASPCVDGLRRPAILLPEDAAAADLRATLIHELAHLARRDCLWNLLRRVASALLWFQPLLWTLSRRIEVAAEEVCDDHVVQFGADRARYAGLLVELAGRSLPPLSPTGVGMISLRSLLARRVVRILDPSRALSTRAGTRAVLMTLSAGLIGTLLVGLLAVGAHEPKVQADELVPKVAAATVPIRGRIIDLEGRPVAGVNVTTGTYQTFRQGNLTLWLDATRQGRPAWVTTPGLEVEWHEAGPDAARPGATTDAAGRFRLDGFDPEAIVTLKLAGPTIAYNQIDVVTRLIDPIPAPGRANQFGPGTTTIYGANFTYTAGPTRVVMGTLKDAKTGEPLAGVEVRSDAFAGSDFIGTMSLRTTTDARGGFRVVGLPPGRPPGSSPERGNRLLIVPSNDQPYFLQQVAVPEPPGTEPVAVDVALQRGIWIEGKITEQATGKPVPGARLSYAPFLTNRFAQTHPVFDKNGNTDGVGFQDRYLSRADGTFRLVGLPGRAIVGALSVDQKYMQGVGAAAIEGVDQSGHFPTYRNPINPGTLWPTSMREVDPPADVEVVHLDLEFRTGTSVRLRVVDATGKPVLGVQTRGRNARGHYDGEPMTTADGEAKNLMPGEERTVLITHEGRKIGRAVRVHAGDDAQGPVVVTLEPLATLTGRVLGADGQPAAAALVRTDLLPGGDFALSLPQVQTDERGRFAVLGVAVGCDYALAVETGVSIKDRRYSFLEKATVRAGATTDVGDIRIKGDAGDLVTGAQVDGSSPSEANSAPPRDNNAAAGLEPGKRVEATTQPASKAEAATVPIRGRIIDLEGRPVAGVAVAVESWARAKGGNLTPWLDALRQGKAGYLADQVVGMTSLVDTHEPVRPEATTDADGRFRLDGLLGEAKVILQLRGETIAYAEPWVVTRPLDPTPAPGLGHMHGPEVMTIYGADFTYTARPGRPVTGVVRDGKTGQPLADAEVRSYQFAGSGFRGVGALRARTDAAGRFRLTGMPKGAGNKLLVVPNDDQPYLMREVDLPDSPGVEPWNVEVPLTRGIWIEGKVVDSATGQPPAGRVWAKYLPFRDNPTTQKLKEFNRAGPGSMDGSGYHDRYTMKPDGSYRVVGLPGRAIVGVEAMDGQYLRGSGSEAIAGIGDDGRFPTYLNPIWPTKVWPTALREIIPSEGVETVHLDLELRMGAWVRLKVVDAAGKPVAGASTCGLANRGTRDGVALATAEGVARHLAPGDVRVVLIWHKDRRIGKSVPLHPGDDANGPVVVTLEPLATLTGRVLDEDGHPCPDLRVRADPLPSGDFSISLPEVTTDAEGRFTVPDVATGCDYDLYCGTKPETKILRGVRVPKITVRAGQANDIGDVELKP